MACPSANTVVESPRSCPRSVGAPGGVGEAMASAKVPVAPGVSLVTRTSYTPPTGTLTYPEHTASPHATELTRGALPDGSVSTRRTGRKPSAVTVARIESSGVPVSAKIRANRGAVTSAAQSSAVSAPSTTPAARDTAVVRQGKMEKATGSITASPTPPRGKSMTVSR